MKYATLSLATLLLCACSSYAPDAGHEIVLVQKPLFFGHGGIASQPVQTGRTFTAITTDGVDVEMRPQRFEAELPDTMTSDGVPISFHAIVTLQVVDSVALIKNFGQGWYRNNVEQPFAQFVRQAVRKHGMNETAISTTALDAIDAEIRDDLVAFIKEKELPVKLVTMTVGRANPPDAIKSQRIETAAQEQRVQTEKQIKLAEDQRKAAEEARAAADNAYRLAIGLSPEQYVQLKRIEMERAVCAEGKCTFIENAGAVPAFNVK
ncbi:MAG TPA: SPFH domain-containing protein [Steroidobacteraceae bacterium]|nr:SPFH domain-containing protein [Steroidobacteraceae bacterium]